MPKQVISFQFVAGTNPYISDINQNLSINSRFVAPPDMDGIAAAAVVTAAGGVVTNESAVCSDSALGKPRKLEFIRASGNSFSVAFADRTDINGVATAIKGIVDPLNGGNNPVVCIKLEGEEFLNLNDELSLNYNGTVFAPSHKAPATALKQNFASGVISYEADAGASFGLTTTHAIRSITEKVGNELSAQLGSAAAGCIGDFLTLQSCGNGRRNPRKHRRYILAFSTKADVADTAEQAQTETIEVPVAGAGALDTLACGNALVALPGLYCIGYKGESYSRVHKLI
ncbi:MAG: hypothetical protein AAFR63_11770 [Cyanobacteria bacterium J06631_6]